MAIGQRAQSCWSGRGRKSAWRSKIKERHSSEIPTGWLCLDSEGQARSLAASGSKRPLRPGRGRGALTSLDTWRPSRRRSASGAHEGSTGRSLRASCPPPSSFSLSSASVPGDGPASITGRRRSHTWHSARASTGQARAFLEPLGSIHESVMAATRRFLHA